jgi:hypothetical protein
MSGYPAGHIRGDTLHGNRVGFPFKPFAPNAAIADRT